MKFCGLIVLLAAASYVKAHCGCLKCSKHLTIAGQSIPVGKCGPAKIIFRGPPGTIEGQTLPVSVQVPFPLGSESSDVALGDLNYKVLGGGPVIGAGGVLGGGSLIRTGGVIGGGHYIGAGPLVGGVVDSVALPRVYDSKIEAPIPSLPTPSGGSINIPLPIPPEKLTACVDRVVIPSPPIDYTTGQVQFNGVISGAPGSVLLPGGVGTIGSVGPVVRTGPYGEPIYAPRRICSGSIVGPGPALFPGEGRVVSGGSIVSGGSVVSGGIIDSGVVGTVGTVGGSGVLVNPYRGSSISYTCSKNHLVPSGPVLDAINKDRFHRYKTVSKLAFIDVVLDDSTVKQSKLDLDKQQNITCIRARKSRLKRDLPLIKHGYKFVMNMLPDFIQQPIKNTVNTFALTHPDRKLQNMYNQPRKLTLMEKIQLQGKRNREFLKKKLLGNRNVGDIAQKAYVNEYLPDKRPRNFLLDLEEPIKPRTSMPHNIYSRFSDVDQNLDCSYEREDIDISTDKIMEILKKTMDANDFDPHPKLLNRYPNLEEYSPEAYKRKSNKEASYMKTVHPKPLFGNIKDIRKQNERDQVSDDFLDDQVVATTPDRISQMTDLQRAIFLKKLKILNANTRRKRSTYFQKKKYLSQAPKDRSVVLDSDQLDLPFYQVKMKDSAEVSEEEKYYRKNDQNGELRDEILRAVIRKELKKFKTERLGEVNKDPFHYKNMVPHSPLFHLINFPLSLIKTFGEFGSQALPFVGSIPKLIVGSKRYFRDFGKNFRRNMLHFFSDVVGDFDNLPHNNNLLEDILNPRRPKRSVDRTKKATNDFDTKGFTEVENSVTRDEKMEQYEPDYSLVFGKRSEEQFEPVYSLVLGRESENFHNSSEAKVRKKRYLLKMVDEDEVEQFLMEKLGGIFGQPEPNLQMSRRGTPHIQTDQNCPFCHLYSDSDDNSEDDLGKKIIIEQLKPKLIIDNNGLPFLEINGYKKPMILGKRKNKVSKRRKYSSNEDFRHYGSSEEASSDKISYLIDHAKNHLEDRLTQRNVEMPIKTIKEKISRQLFDTDMLVHMDFDKYHDIYDDLFKIQHIKTSVVQDWKRLLMSRRVNDINGKISLLGKFQEMQHFKDDVSKRIAYALSEDCDNRFATKNLVKMLVRLQKLQCIINDVVGNFREKLQMQSQFDTEKEIKYVEFLGSINFVNAKTRNEMVDNLRKSRDVALQQNIVLLDRLKKLLMYEHDHDKISEEASLLWEMGNIEKMQLTTIEEMNHRLGEGHKIKKELKILFDLLKRQEACEMEQKNLLSKFEEGNSEDESSEEDDRLGRKRVLTKKKFDINEFRAKWQERLNKRKVLLRKNLRKSLRNRNIKTTSRESSEEE